MGILDSLSKNLFLAPLKKIWNARDTFSNFQVNLSGLCFGISASLLTGFVIYRFAVSLIIFAVRFLYPAYMTFKTIESTNRSEEDTEQWLTYWVVLPLLLTFEGIIGIVLESLIPAYHILKILFYVWLVHKRMKGALRLYRILFRRLLKRYESQIDGYLMPGLLKKVDLYFRMLRKYCRNLLLKIPFLLSKGNFYKL